MPQQIAEIEHQGTLGVQAELNDAGLRESLLGMAARRSSVVHNGRFFFSRALNALTYWYEDGTQSTRMVYIEADEIPGGVLQTS